MWLEFALVSVKHQPQSAWIKLVNQLQTCCQELIKCPALLKESCLHKNIVGKCKIPNLFESNRLYPPMITVTQGKMHSISEIEKLTFSHMTIISHRDWTRNNLIFLGDSNYANTNYLTTPLAELINLPT